MDNLHQTVEGTNLQQRLEYLFVGKMEIATKCQTVDFETKKEEHFWDLQLPLDSTKYDDISGAFAQYVEPTNISG